MNSSRCVNPPPVPDAQPPPQRLLDRLREAIRVRHCSIRAEEVCVDWARRFIRFNGKHHPQAMGAVEVGWRPS